MKDLHQTSSLLFLEVIKSIWWDIKIKWQSFLSSIGQRLIPNTRALNTGLHIAFPQTKYDVKLNQVCRILAGEDY